MDLARGDAPRVEREDIVSSSVGFVAGLNSGARKLEAFAEFVFREIPAHTKIWISIVSIECLPRRITKNAIEIARRSAFTNWLSPKPNAENALYSVMGTPFAANMSRRSRIGGKTS